MGRGHNHCRAPHFIGAITVSLDREPQFRAKSPDQGQGRSPWNGALWWGGVDDLHDIEGRAGATKARALVLAAVFRLPSPLVLRIGAADDQDQDAARRAAPASTTMTRRY